MRWRAPLVLMLLPLVAGCTTNGEPANPNLLTPKVVLDTLPNGSWTVYVHSHFVERRYDAIEVRIDNETAVVRQDAYSVEHVVDAPSFFLEVKVLAAETPFVFRGRVAAAESADRVEVAALTLEGEWGDARRYSLPYERFLERPPLPEAT
jgi:hypothetical protein